jgi:hypothetical protein
MPTELGIADNPRAVIGGNAPPPTPFEIAEKAVNDIYEETALWLDGHKIDSKEMADGVGNLLTAIRAAEKLADDTRKAEKEPLDEAIKEVQARYAPLIADTKAVKGKTVRAAEACKAALQPWLIAEDARLRAEAQAKRDEADRRRREAEEALRASDAQNLAEREAAEAKLSEARRAETAANVASRQTATAGGAFGRSAGLRTVWVVAIDDPVVAARSCWAEAREVMIAAMQDWAEREVRSGRHAIPGFKITEDRRAA